MRTGVEIYPCDKCKTEHRADFPIAGSSGEYNSALTQLPRPFSQFENDECRRMVICGVDGCDQKIGEPILGKSFVDRGFESCLRN